MAATWESGVRGAPEDNGCTEGFQDGAVRWRACLETDKRGLRRIPNPHLAQEVRGKCQIKAKRARTLKAHQKFQEHLKAQIEKKCNDSNISSAVKNTVRSHQCAFRIIL